MIKITKPVKIIGFFSKDKNYTIVKCQDTLFALYNYNQINHTCEKIYEAKNFSGLIGIGPEISNIP